MTKAQQRKRGTERDEVMEMNRETRAKRKNMRGLSLETQ